MKIIIEIDLPGLPPGSLDYPASIGLGAPDDITPYGNLVYKMHGSGEAPNIVSRYVLLSTLITFRPNKGHLLNSGKNEMDF